MVEPIAALRSRNAGAPRSASGFTIIETLVAMVVLMIAVLAAALLFERGLATSRDTRNRVVAAQVASQAIETIRGPAADASKFTAVIDPIIGQTVTTRTVNATNFTITQDVQWVSQNSDTSICDAGSSSAAQMLQVSETVTWPDMRGTQPVRSVTSLAPPVGAYSSTSGAIAVKVLDAGGQPADGINVGISGPYNDSQLTTTQGCAFFFGTLPAGAYTVKILDGLGIGDQEVKTPSQSAAVVLGQVSSKTFNFDKPAVVTFGGNSITNWPWTAAGVPASGIPVSVGNTGIQPYFQYSWPSGTLAAEVYPYANGYNVFAGNCKDNNPLGKDATNNLFYPSEAPTVVPVAPGGTTTAPNTSLYGLGVLVKNGVLNVAGATVSVTPTSGLGSASSYNALCTNGAAATATGPTLAFPPTLPTGTTFAGVPLGHWSITARSGALSGCIRVWVKPDGVYNVNNSTASNGIDAGKATTLITAVPTIPIVTGGAAC